MKWAASVASRHAPHGQDLHRLGQHLALHRRIVRFLRGGQLQDGLHHVHARGHMAERGIAGIAAIGLAILVVYFRNRGSIAVEDVNLMKG